MLHDFGGTMGLFGKLPITMNDPFWANERS